MVIDDQLRRFWLNALLEFENGMPHGWEQLAHVLGLESKRAAREPGTGQDNVNQMLATLDIAVQVRGHWMGCAGCTSYCGGVFKPMRLAGWC
jgi:hypothetical protein